jgi:hypothetical protein
MQLQIKANERYPVVSLVTEMMLMRFYHLWQRNAAGGILVVELSHSKDLIKRGLYHPYLPLPELYPCMNPTVSAYFATKRILFFMTWQFSIAVVSAPYELDPWKVFLVKELMKIFH